MGIEIARELAMTSNGTAADGNDFIFQPHDNSKGVCGIDEYDVETPW